MVICCLVLTVCAASAQSGFHTIAANRSLSASNYGIYPDSIEPANTPSPAGKKPFYISHYGRHGSRYLANRKGYDIPYRMLCKADSLDELTPIGQDVLRELRQIIDDSEGRWGDLTGLGKKQQRNIAQRMMARFAEAFPDGTHIDARSTTASRCILSMGAAVQEMVALKPTLRPTMHADRRDMFFLNHQDKQLRDSMMPFAARQAYDAFVAKRERNPRLMELLFVDPECVREYVDEGWLSYYLLKTGLVQQNTHMYSKTRLVDMFSLEEIHQFWQRENAWWYINYGPSPLSGGVQPYSQRYLLRRIIADADSCIRRAQPTVQLRFGHETVLLPLVCLMGINGYDYQTPDLERLEDDGWWACLVFPMASNIQLVFYRESPRDKDILVKVLLNEREATLPFPTDVAPYYHWSDFRDYYLRKLDAYDGK